MNLDYAYCKTSRGIDVIATRSVKLNASQRVLLLLCNGNNPMRNVLELAKRAKAQFSDCQLLLNNGLIEELHQHSPTTQQNTQLELTRLQNDQTDRQLLALLPQERLVVAIKLATKLSSHLGLRGFMLRLKIEQALSLAELAVLGPKLLEAAEQSSALDSAEDLRCLEMLFHIEFSSL